MGEDAEGILKIGGEEGGIRLITFDRERSGVSVPAGVSYGCYLLLNSAIYLRDSLLHSEKYHPTSKPCAELLLFPWSFY